MMTRAETLQWLAQLDDPQRGEYPLGFDAAAAAAQVPLLAQAIERAVGCSCAVECGSDIQDAAFHGQIVLSRDLWHADGDAIFVRLSNFGGMATVSCYSAAVPERYLTPLVECLEAAGYVYVPEEILQEPYTGPFPLYERETHAAWWFRYFDYL